MKKQPPEVFCKKRGSEKFRKTHKNSLLLTKLQTCRLGHRYFLVNFCETFQNTFFTEHLGATATRYAEYHLVFFIENWKFLETIFLQKQSSPGVVLDKKCSWKFRKIYGKISALFLRRFLIASGRFILAFYFQEYKHLAWFLWFWNFFVRYEKLI